MAGLDDDDDDYVLCPPLSAWLPARLGPEFAVWTLLRRLPRSMRAWARSPDDPLASPRGLLVVSRPRDGADAVPSEVLEALPPGAPIADVCLPRRTGPLEWASAPLRARRMHDFTAVRLSQWLVRGMADVEQWVTLDDALVTFGHRR